MSLKSYLTESIRTLEKTLHAWDEELVNAAISVIVDSLRRGNALLVCGNGGSAADALHLRGELVGRFLRDRKPLKVICLASDPVFFTAWSNDHGFERVFAREVEAYGTRGAVLLGISTSGNSRNVIAAFEQARAMNITTVALTGEGGGQLAALSDYLFAVPCRSTPLIQQAHLCLYHYMCGEIETRTSASS